MPNRTALRLLALHLPPGSLVRNPTLRTMAAKMGYAPPAGHLCIMRRRLVADFYLDANYVLTAKGVGALAEGRTRGWLRDDDFVI